MKQVTEEEEKPKIISKDEQEDLDYQARITKRIEQKQANLWLDLDIKF